MPRTPGRRSRWIRLGALFACAGALSMLSLKLLPAPFVWIALVWALACFAGIGVLERPWSPKPFFLLFNAAVVAVILAGVEGYLTLREGRNSQTYSDGYRLTNDVLGAVPAKGVRARSTKIEDGRLLYDVTYSIDAFGRRVAPPFDDGPSCSSILFFGDSFTFGEGLEDTETLPYQVGLRSGGRFQSLNFGYHGYGPHQMLAALENGIVQREVNCQPRLVVYEAIPHHALRVAGKVPFGRHGPRYRLTSNGSVQRAGRFDDDVSAAASWPSSDRLRGQVEKSAIYRSLTKPGDQASDEEDVRLMLAIVRRSRDLAKAQFPGVGFHVLLWISWPQERQTYEQLQRGFRDLDIPTHLVERILPDYERAASPYVLSDTDRHPTALANRLLADYVLERIIPATMPGAPASAECGRNGAPGRVPVAGQRGARPAGARGGRASRRQ